MHFKDQAIILSKTPLKEKSSIITVFTQNNGIYSGVLRQYSKKTGDSLVEGNLIDFIWSSRLHEHIGSVKAELIKAYNICLMTNKTKLYAFNSIVSMLKNAFCEREPHNRIFPILLLFMKNIKQDFSLIDYINLELDLLKEAGYQLQFEKCVATGNKTDLIYISPKSGQAVSKLAGTPYKDKLLKLPQFLIKENNKFNQQKININEINDAFKLVSYFFERYILINKPMPIARTNFLNLIQQQYINQ